MSSFYRGWGKAIKSPEERSKFAYWVMVVFSFLYYFRPEDLMPASRVIPVAKITGSIALLALFLGTSGKERRKLSPEVKLLFLMFAWLVITVPFSWWRGGSFAIVAWEFSKAVIVALTLTLAVTQFRELRRLIFVQAVGVALATIAAVILNHRMAGRLAGLGEGTLTNPNDLAMNIALNWPLCLAFVLVARNAVSRLFWALSILVMMYAVMATYSRSGFLALAAAVLLSLWEFGFRGKRFYMLIGAMILAVGSLAVSPKDYSTRLETLLGKFQAGDKDNGSAEARRDLLVKSLQITATHPIFGVGPGNFPAFTKTWLVTHNTYTQFSSECGIPALIMFLVLLKKALANVTKVRKSLTEKYDKELRVFAGALWAGMVAYLIGAFFAATAYQLFPYYMVTYTTVLYNISFARTSSNRKSAVFRKDLNASKVKRDEKVIPQRVPV